MVEAKRRNTVVGHLVSALHEEISEPLVGLPVGGRCFG